MDAQKCLWFRSETPFACKFGSKKKKENCQFKLKFGTYNYVHNILRLFDGWTNFSLTSTETKCGY